MADYGSRVADKAIATLEKKIRQVYKQAGQELTGKLDAFLSRFSTVITQKRGLLAEGKITQQQFNQWLTGQLFQEKQWRNSVDQAVKIMNTANQQSMNIINGQRMDVFAENYNYCAYELEKEVGADLDFELCSTETVERLVKDDPELLPKWKIDQPKDYKWNYEKANNSITQGIIQGESVDDIAKRLTATLCAQNENKMQMFARTATTGAENAGRIGMMHDSVEQGIKIKKKWLATLDDRTRDTHRDLDGQVQEVDDPFTSDLGDIMFPGDTSADPANVYNCRCTLTYVYEGMGYNSVRRDQDDNLVENMTYNEWKQGKQPEQQPESEAAISVESIKEYIANHTGDWAAEQLQEVGEMYSNIVEERTAEAREEYRKLFEEEKQLRQKVKDLEQEANELFAQNKREEAVKILNKADDVRAAASDKLGESIRARRELVQQQSQAVRDVLAEIRPVGGVDETNVDSYANLKAYGSYHGKELRQRTIEALNYYPKEWLRISANDSHTLIPHWTDARAYYNYGEIRFTSNVAANIHELGHRFEHVITAIRDAEQVFYNKRTAGEKLEWMGSGYRRNEKTRKDNFIDKYMGKDYAGVAFELVSMGFEYVLTDYTIFDRDEDMRNWILGILAGM